MRIALFIITAIFLAHSVHGQSDELWSPIKSNTNFRSSISVTRGLNYELKKQSLQNKLKIATASSPATVSLPLANGEFKEFILTPNNLIPASLAAKYPEIQTFEATSLDGEVHGKVDITPSGFHSMLFTKEGTVFTDPISNENNTTHQVYYKQDFEAYSKGGIADDQLLNKDGAKNSRVNLSAKQAYKSRANGTELRTYRLAITTTGEYTTFHGGTVAGALAAIVTTMNRVNGIYEKEVAISFVLIDNTDDLIYTDFETDPYTNDEGDVYINEVQENIDAIIGNANYDIGHGFSTGGGGLAGPGPCQAGLKANGITGISSPTGDPFDVDYVAHEIGHQFGANHTFNSIVGSCDGNRNTSTAYEPGSGSTILAYAGICSPQNLQNNSDAYFHTISYDEILAYTIDGPGNTCASITSTGNNPPTVDAGSGGYIIPIGTPFQLTGSGSDPDGDVLTYNWEQFDLGPEGSPDNPTGNAPIFRSFTPTSEPTRLFPQLSDILNNTQTLGEILPSYTRSLTFRLTVRDNKSGGGGVNYDQIAFDVTDQAGPFMITLFNTTSSVFSNDNVTIQWDVANTNLSPINCNFVNILLSDDGGQTFAHTLISNTANDGIESVFIPEITTSNARIRVEAVNNIFFDINNADIELTPAPTPDFNIDLSTTEVDLCNTVNLQISVNIGSIAGFTESVSLVVSGVPEGLTASLDNNIVNAGGSTTLTLSNTTASGIYFITISATASGKTKTSTVKVNAYDGILSTVDIINPINGESEASVNPEILWNKLEDNSTYDLDIALDNAFINIIASASNLESTNYYPTELLENTTYFLRLRSTSSCEISDYTTINFTTQSIVCSTTASSDVPKTIASASPNSITSTIDVTTAGIIEDLNVLNISGTHSFINDLTFELTSPSGTTITLLSHICNSEDDFNFNLDDEAGNTIFSCPPIGMDTYKPLELLNTFDGENAQGTWTLTISDSESLDGGELQSWSLEICNYESSSSPIAPTNLSLASSDGKSIQLSWVDNSNIETGFNIERSEGDNLNFQSIGTASTNKVSFNDIDVVAGSSYFYRVKALNNTFESVPSNQASSQLPTPPSMVKADSVGNQAIYISWADVNTGTNSFTIERASENGNFVAIDNTGGTVTFYQDLNINAATEYQYRVKLKVGNFNSDYSDTLSLTSLPLPPTAPGNLALELISLDQINLTWLDNSGNEDGFIIERSAGDNSNYQLLDSLDAESSSFQDLTLGEPDIYFYRIKAYNTGGESSYSNEASESSLVLSTLNDLNSKISLYPNPSSEVFHLKIPNSDTRHKVDIKVLDMIGNEVTPAITAGKTDIYTIDLSRQAKGIYFIKVSIDQKTTILKALKSSE
jgi:subtilisin-like proprotein convertase family protein